MATQTKRDYYEVLGIARDADLKAIKAAYRKLAVRFHPDRNPDDPEAETRFKEASEAYAVLSDTNKRANYDRFGHQGVEGQGFTGFDPTAFGDFADILGDLFGFGDIFGTRRRGGRRSGPRRGRDLQYTLKIDLEEAATGIERTVRVPRLEECDTCNGTGAEPGTTLETCSTCGGSGQVAFRRGFLSVAQTCPSCNGGGRVNRHPCTSCSGQGRVERESSLRVKVPPGIDTGMRLRLTGEGEGGVQGGPRGDLYVAIVVEPHDVLQRNGNDLHMELPISAFKAMLGTQVELNTILGDTVKVDIEPGSQPGDVVEVRGAGMPDLDGGRKGALHLHLKVVIPRRLTGEQRKLLREAAKLGGDTDVAESEGLLDKLERWLIGS
jgi:molecular chaperone DnaJ